MADQTANVVLSADVSQYNAEIDSAASKTQALTARVSSLVTTVDKIGKGVRKGLFSFAAADAAVLTGVTLAAGKFEKELGTLKSTLALSQKSTDTANASLKGYRTEIQKLSTTVPASRQEVTGLMTMMAKLGVTSAESASKAVKTVLELGHATGESATTIANNLVQLNTQMGTSMGTVSKFSDQLAVLSVKANSSVESITSFASSLAPIARTAGMTEKELLAVSAAFNKAGAEGFAAANAYNTILSDITNSIQTGSPAISKYANLLGVTVDQFKRMGAAEYTSKLFDEISRGGPNAINLLNQLGIEGIRAQRAIQAVASTGGIQAMLGASNNTEGAADRGGKAATENLFDELEKSKHRMENFAVSIGEPLAKAATVILNAFNKIAEFLDPVTNSFAKLLSVVLPIAGVIAGITASMLALVKVMAIPALLSFLGKSTGIGSFRAGAGSTASTVQPYNTRMGAYQAQMTQPGMTPAMANQNLAGMGMKPVSWYERGGYRLGEMANQAGLTGAQGGPAGAASNFRQGLSRLGGGLFQGWAKYNQWSAGYINDSIKQGYDRGSVSSPGAGGAMSTGMSNMKGMFDQFKQGAVSFKDLSKSVVSLGGATSSLKSSFLSSSIMNTNLSRGTAALLGSFAQLTSASARLALSLARSAVSKVGGAIGGMLGQMGPMIAIMAAMGAYQAWNSEKERKAAAFEDDRLHRIKVYDDALGITTKKILSFGEAVDQANGITSASKPTSISAASTVSNADYVQTYSKAGYTNQDVATLSKGEAVTWVKSLGITDPQEMQAVKLDLIKRFGGDAQGIIDQAVGSTNTAKSLNANDVEAMTTVGMRKGKAGLSGLLLGSEYTSNVNEGWFDTYKNTLGFTSDAAFNQMDTAIGTSRSFASQQASQFGEKAGSQARYVGLIKLMKGLQKFDPSMRADLLGRIEQEYFGGESLGLNADGSVKDWMKTIGKERLADRFKGTTDFNMKTAEQTLRSLQSGQSNPYFDRISKSSASGTYAIDRQMAQIGDQDTAGLYRAQMGLAENAMKLGGSFSGAYDDLQKMKIAIGNVDDKMYKLAKSAQEYLQYQEQRKVPFQTREVNFSNVQKKFITAAEDYKKNPNDQNVLDEYTASKAEYEKKQDEYQSFLQGMLQTYRSFNKQMQRAEEDHTRQLKRASEDAAKSIYDPYSKMQAQRVTSANYLVENMEQQTAALIRQKGNLKKLQKGGLSMQVVDMLGLSETGNAQQLESLVQQIAADPNIIKKLNKSVKGKVGATGELVNSPFSRQYRLAEEDRKRNIENAKQDLADSFVQFTGSVNDMAKAAMKATNSTLGTQGKAIKAEISTIASQIKTAQKEIQDTTTTNMAVRSGKMAMDAANSAGSLGLTMTDYGPRYTSHKGQSSGLYSVAYTLASMGKIDSVDIKKANAYLADQKFLAGSPDAGHAVSIYKKKNGEDLYAVYMGGDKVSFKGSVYTNKQFYSANPGYSLKGYKAFAEGGIATGPTMGLMAEAGSAEAVIPLNSRGLGFMANFTGMVAREVMQLAYSSPINRTNSSSEIGNTSINRSTNFNGQITVVAQDPNEMARKLESQRRMRALTGAQ